VIGLGLALLAFAGGSLSWPVGAAMGAVLAIAVASLLMPVLGLHRRIRDAKERALEDLAEELQVIRRRERADQSPPPGRIADLFTYRAYVDSLPDWPFDPRTRRRFGLFGLIPLGGWLGGALVEWALGWWLG